MSEVRNKLFGMVVMAAPTPDLHWRMTPIALSKVRDLVVIVPNVRPFCMGIPVEVVAPSVYRASEVALGDGPMVTL